MSTLVPYEIVFRKMGNNQEGRYSITRPYEANQIVNIIKNSIPSGTSEYEITDCTAGVGGDTINFSYYFSKVNAIEICEKQYKLLEHNANLSPNKNITCYRGNFLDIIGTLKQDIMYMDPPWGGIGYKEIDKLDIYICNYSLVDIIKNIVFDGFTRYLFIKLPLNIDIEKLNSHIHKIHTIHNKKKNPSFYLVEIKNAHSQGI